MSQSSTGLVERINASGIEITEAGPEPLDIREAQLNAFHAHHDRTGGWPSPDIHVVLPGTPLSWLTDLPIQLQEWRLHRGQTQRDLAARSGLALTSINEIETGKRKPRPATIKRLAVALDTDDWNLFNLPGVDEASIPQVIKGLDRLSADLLKVDTYLDGSGFALNYEYLLRVMHRADDQAVREGLRDVWANVGGFLLPFVIGLWRETTNRLWALEDERGRQQMASNLTNWRRDIKTAGPVDEFNFTLPHVLDDA